MIERYFITSAVNNCEVNMNAFNAMKSYCEVNNATFIVLPIKYTPKAIGSEEVRWDWTIEAYLQNQDFTIGNRVTVLPTVNIRPTAVKPLTGLASFSHDSDVIFAHPRLHLETVVTIDEDEPIFNYTTGTVTEPNYTKSKTGAKALFHHSFGGVIVEVDTEKNQTHTRQVSVSGSGSMIDIDTEYRTDGTAIKSPAEGIVFGDSHIPFVDPAIIDKAYFGKESLLHVCQPKEVVLHDVMDFKTKSHHLTGRPFEVYLVGNQKVSFMDEIKMSMTFIDDISKSCDKVVLVDSNHHNHLGQYLERCMHKGIHDMQHAKSIMGFCTRLLDAIDEKQDAELTPYDKMDIQVPDIFGILVSDALGDKVRVLEPNDSYNIASFSVSSHGHIGMNGSRTLAGIANKTNHKLITGHSHTARRIDGHLTVGTLSKLRRSYTKGFSTWSNTNAIIHSNKKAQLVTHKYLDKSFRVDGKTTSKGKLVTVLEMNDYTPSFVEEVTVKGNVTDRKYTYQMINLLTHETHIGTGYRSFLGLFEGVGQRFIQSALNTAKEVEKYDIEHPTTGHKLRFVATAV